MAPAAVFEDLDKLYNKQKSSWCEHYLPVVKRKGDTSEEQCFLECKRCQSLLSVAKISDSVLHHNNSCKKRKLPQQQVLGLAASTSRGTATQLEGGWTRKWCWMAKKGCVGLSCFVLAPRCLPWASAALSWPLGVCPGPQLLCLGP